MQTRTSHELTATEVTANHRWDGSLELVATEVIGEQKTDVTIKVTPSMLKKLVQCSGRNALIDAKVLRGKKNW